LREVIKGNEEIKNVHLKSHLFRPGAILFGVRAAAERPKKLDAGWQGIGGRGRRRDTYSIIAHFWQIEPACERRSRCPTGDGVGWLLGLRITEYAF